MRAPGLAALSEVLTGWTGSITLSSTPHLTTFSTTVTPRARESVASLFARLIADACAEQIGLELSMRLLGSDALVIYSDLGATFDMTFAGNCASRCDFDSGPYSGATEYSSDANLYSGAVVPTYGLRLDSLGLATGQGRATADGSGAQSPTIESGQGTLQLWDTFARCFDWQTDLLGTYDVWHDGRVQGRVRVDGWKQIPPGSLRTGMMRIDGQVQAVAE